MLPRHALPRSHGLRVINLSLLAAFLFGAAACGAVQPPDVETVTGDVSAPDAPLSTDRALSFQSVTDDAGARAATQNRTLIRTGRGYQEFFGHAPPAAIDFSREWVVFYGAGSQPGGYGAGVATVTLSGSSLVVVTELVAPGAGCPVPASGGGAAVYALVKLPAQPGVMIDFRKKDRTGPSCPPPSPCAAVLCPAGQHCEAQAARCADATTCQPTGVCVADPPKVVCGGLAGIVCPGQGKCVDDPSDGCDASTGGVDCGGVCQCAVSTCPSGSTFDASPSVCACSPPPPTKVRCGGIAGATCPGFGRCVDDPSDSCDPNAGGADCGGICQCIDNVDCAAGTVFDSTPSVCTCVKASPHTCGPVCDIFCAYGSVLDADGCPTCTCNPPPGGPKVGCGGIAGFPCPGLGKCVDDPSDSCDPNAGGADCGGICSCIDNVSCVAGTVFDSSPSVCSCVPQTPPICNGPVCAIYCANGYLLDASGCPSCGCNPSPPTACPVAKCPSPAPAAPNVICADGTTVGGPACVVMADGTCGWTIVSCPTPTPTPTPSSP
jgi:hypothetical protein